MTSDSLRRARRTSSATRESNSSGRGGARDGKRPTESTSKLASIMCVGDRRRRGGRRSAGFKVREGPGHIRRLPLRYFYSRYSCAKYTKCSKEGWKVLSKISTSDRTHTRNRHSKDEETKSEDALPDTQDGFMSGLFVFCVCYSHFFLSFFCGM